MTVQLLQDLPPFSPATQKIAVNARMKRLLPAEMVSC